MTQDQDIEAHFVDDFHQHSLLWVHSTGLDGLDPEKFGIEQAKILVDQVRIPHVAPPMVGMIGMIEAVGAETGVGNLAANMARFAKELPQLRGRRGVPGKATRTADDGDGLVELSRHIDIYG